MLSAKVSSIISVQIVYDRTFTFLEKIGVMFISTVTALNKIQEGAAVPDPTYFDIVNKIKDLAQLFLMHYNKAV